MKNEIIEKMATLITSAFALVAALAWNEAIQAIFRRAYGEAEGIWAMLIYAMVVTVVAVVATVWIARLALRIGR